MHLTVLVISQGVLLQTLINNFIGYNHLIGTVGLYDQLQDVEQLACIAARKTEYGGGLLKLDVALL